MLEARMIGMLEDRLKRAPSATSLTLWNGRTIQSGDESGTAPDGALAAGADVAGQSQPGQARQGYVEGDLDLDGDIRETIRIGEQLVCRRLPTTYRRRSDDLEVVAAHPSRRPQDIQHHYDVGNEFYGLVARPQPRLLLRLFQEPPTIRSTSRRNRSSNTFAASSI